MSQKELTLQEYTKQKLINVITGNCESDQLDLIMCYRSLDRSINLIDECKKIIAFQKDVSISSCYKFIDTAFYRQLLLFSDDDMKDFMQLSKKYPNVAVAKCMANYSSKPSSIIDNNVINLGPIIAISSGKIKKVSSIDNVDNTLIASGLTFLSSDVFMKLSLSELMSITYSDKYDEAEAPSVNRLIKYVNKVSQWVASEILNRSECADQIGIFKKFANVMTHLKSNNDFSSLMAVFAGLNNSSIQRLDHIKELESLEFSDVNQLMSSQRNYKAYREYFDSLLYDESKIKIPYLGIYITDIKFIHDNFKGKHLMSYEEFDSIYRDICMIVNKLKKCKHRLVNSNNGSEGFIMYFERYSVLNDKQLYAKSCLIKPMRSSTKERLVDLPVLETQRSFSMLTKKRLSREIPKAKRPVESWSVNDVMDWLQTLGLNEYAKAFENHEINGKRLLHLLDFYQNDNFLKEDLGMIKLGHRIELILGIKELNNIKN